MADNFDFLKELGLKPENLKGKSKKAIMEMIAERSKNRTAELAGEQEKELIDNIKSKLPNIKKTFENPFEILVKKVGQKESVTAVKVVGYCPYIKDRPYIVFKSGDKVNYVSESDLIKTEDELADARAKDKEKKKAGRKPKAS